MNARATDRIKESSMKRMSLFLAALAVVAGAQAATADCGPRPPRPTFSEIDVNGDGVVTEEEFVAPMLAHVSERFAMIDTNGDGVLTEAELEAAPRPPHRPRAGTE
jgi:EF hand